MTMYDDAAGVNNITGHTPVSATATDHVAPAQQPVAVDGQPLPPEALRFLCTLDPRSGRRWSFQTFDDKGKQGKPGRPHLARIVHGDVTSTGGFIERDVRMAPVDANGRFVKRGVAPAGYRADPAPSFTSLSAGGAGIFVMVAAGRGRTRDATGRELTSGRTANDVVDTTAVWADFDACEPPYDRFPVPPSVVVRTSPGKHHCYWCLDVPTGDFAAVKGVLARLVEYGGDAAATDVARVLRVPGYRHNKQANGPIVEIVSPAPGETVQRYSLAELLAAFPPATADMLARATVQSPVAPVTAPRAVEPYDSARVRALLAALPKTRDALRGNDRRAGRETTPWRKFWYRAGMAIHHASGGSGAGFDDWHAWSSQVEDYAGETDCQDRWRSFKKDRAGPVVTLASLVEMARRYGYREGAAADDGVEIDPADFINAAAIDLPDDGVSALDWALARQRARTPWDGPAIGELFARMNRDHAFLARAGDGAYVWAPRKGVSVRYLSAAGMAREYAAIRWTDRKDRPVKAFHAWDTWEGRRRVTGVGVYPPTMHAIPANHMNLYQGWGVTPRAGEWPWIAGLIRDVCAGGNLEVERWLLWWLATWVQNPHRPGQVCPIFQGTQGIGKSTLGHIMLAIFGPHGLKVNSLDEVTGKFNSSLEMALFLFGDDITWGNTGATLAILKTLMTSPKTTIEGKGRDRYQTDNKIKLMVATNNDHAMTVGRDERRFSVIAADPVHLNDTTYFRDLHRAIGVDRDWNVVAVDGGELATFLHYLLHLDVTGVAPPIPATEAMDEQRDASLPPVERWLLDFADGNADISSGSQRWSLAPDVPTTLPCADVITAAQAAAGRGGRGQISGKRVGSVLRKCGVEMIRNGTARTPVYRFPPADVFQAAVYQRLDLGVPQAPPAEPEAEIDVAGNMR